MTDAHDSSVPDADDEVMDDLVSLDVRSQVSDDQVEARSQDWPVYDAAHDREVDDQLDRIDDGSSVVETGGEDLGVPTSDLRSEALPFVLTAREHFASAGDVEITGDARVDAATARLDEIPDLPTSDHVAVYDDVHRRLQDALSDAEVR